MVPSSQAPSLTKKNYSVCYSLEKLRIDVTQYRSLCGVLQDLHGYDPIHTKTLYRLVENLMTIDSPLKSIEVKI